MSEWDDHIAVVRLNLHMGHKTKIIKKQHDGDKLSMQVNINRIISRWSLFPLIINKMRKE